MLKILTLIITVWGCWCVIDPAHFSDQLRTLLPKQMTIIHQDLGRTVNGFNILAYGLTSIAGIPAQVHLSDLAHYPSSIITSYMHGTDENAVNLLYGYVANMLRNYQDDYYIKNVLTHGIVWLVPFISIDAYQLTQRVKPQLNRKQKQKVDTSKQAVQATQQHPRKGSMKNMNKYPDQSRASTMINCQNTTANKFTGVNLNYNFLKQIGPQYADVCDDNYAGPAPISQQQTIAIVKLFKTLKVTAVIDLQVGNDKWVVPHRNIWDNKDDTQPHQYGYLYKDITNKLTKMQKQYIEQPTQVHAKKTQNKMDRYSGGFVNWAALNNTLAFKYLITPQKSGQGLKKSINTGFSVMDMIIKKNAPLYNKYRSQDNLKLYVQSISLNQFSIRCEIVFGTEESIIRDYEVGIGKLVEINVEIEQYRYRGFNKQLEYRPQPQIRLFVRGTIIAEVVGMDKLPYVDQLPIEQNPYARKTQVGEQKSIPTQAMLVLALVLLTPIVICSLLLIVRKNKHHYKAVRSANDDTSL